MDVNVWLGRWPFRNVGSDNPNEMLERLRNQGVDRACVGSIDGLFHRDIEGVNHRLADACQAESATLIGFGTVNPLSPDWEEDLRRCKDEHRFAGIRIAPAYHGYALDDSSVLRLFDLAAKANLLVQIVVSMEDQRTMHPILRVPNVDIRPLAAIARDRPSLRLMLLGVPPALSIVSIAEVSTAGQVFVEMSMVEGVDRLASLVDQVGAARVLFGSHYPLFYLESAVLKIRESELPETFLDKIRSGNAAGLIDSAC